MKETKEKNNKIIIDKMPDLIKSIDKLGEELKKVNEILDDVYNDILKLTENGTGNTRIV